VRRLARHDDIAVAEPILTQSKRLSDSDLIEIAQTKTQAHLLAISGRQHINESVTDALLERGDDHVFLRLAGNHGANFSEGGFANLVRRSERDERLAGKIGRRLDVPIRLFRELLLRATEAVRARLLAAASPEARAHIQRILADISEDLGHEAGVENEQDYAEAYARALEIRRQGQLSGVTLFEFAKAGRRIDVIAGLALLCAAPQALVDKLLQIQQREAFLIPCKAANLDWPTVRAILNCCSIGGTVADQDLDQARSDYTKLSQSSAQRVLRFWQVRQGASKDDAGAAAVTASAAVAR